MFQTHAFDSWTADADRANAFWWTSRHLGGFPSRLFLLLAGVSLMLRFDSDRRKGIDPAASRRGAARRGLEVIALGYLFRIFEWLLGGAGRSFALDMLRVDILNCIGLSLVLSAYIAAPSDLEDHRLPWRPALATLAIVFATPYLEQVHWPHFLPRALTSYLSGAKPLAFFPMFPWMSYVLSGCVVGALLIRAARHERTGRAIAVVAAVGLLMALGGQLARRADMALYSFGDNQAAPTSPTAYFYRTGMCLLGLAAAWLVCRRAVAARFSWLNTLGRASLFVYWIHVELVYGHLSDPIKRRLALPWAGLLLLALTAAMVALAWWRTERFGRRAAPVAAPAAGSGG
jgi:uncharacterized membrane protein